MAEYYVDTEIESQPACWRQAMTTGAASALPVDGERVAVLGCGTSLYMARAYAARREAAGRGETDAFAASEAPRSRDYDHYVAITRSGTTTEIIEALVGLSSARTTVLTALPEGPAAEAAGAVVDLSFADERSVVQTRFATTTLALLRASLGEDIDGAADDAERALTEPLPDRWTAAEQATFLGRGWTVGLAEEAALKSREAAQAWSEAYPAMEYRHGPISIAQPGRLVWTFGPAPAGLADDVAATGATFVERTDLDPMAHLVAAQRLAVARAHRLGLDPDRPRSLTRSVVLS